MKRNDVLEARLRQLLKDCGGSQGCGAIDSLKFKEYRRIEFFLIEIFDGLIGNDAIRFSCRM